MIGESTGNESLSLSEEKMDSQLSDVLAIILFPEQNRI